MKSPQWSETRYTHLYTASPETGELVLESVIDNLRHISYPVCLDPSRSERDPAKLFGLRLFLAKGEKTNEM